MLGADVDVAAGAVAAAIAHFVTTALPTLIVLGVLYERCFASQTVGRSLVCTVGAGNVTRFARVEIVVVVKPLAAGVDAAISCQRKPWYTSAALVRALSAAFDTRGMARETQITTFEEARAARMNTVLFLIQKSGGTRQTR